jgi:hypothetical protein
MSMGPILVGAPPGANDGGVAFQLLTAAATAI